MAATGRNDDKVETFAEMIRRHQGEINKVREGCIHKDVVLFEEQEPHMVFVNCMYCGIPLFAFDHDHVIPGPGGYGEYIAHYKDGCRHAKISVVEGFPHLVHWITINCELCKKTLFAYTSQR